MRAKASAAADFSALEHGIQPQACADAVTLIQTPGRITEYTEVLQRGMRIGEPLRSLRCRRQASA